MIQAPDVERKKARFRGKMLTGVAALVPIVVTFLVLQTVFRWLDGFAQPLIKQIFQRETDIPGLGIGLTLLAVWLTGLLAGNVFGRRLLRKGGDILSNLPVISTIYVPVRQFIDTLASAENEPGFKRVVLAEYPSEGLWILGFATGQVQMDADGRIGSCVFIPTAPNPATGWMVIAHEEKIRDTDLTVEDAMRLIVSGGIVIPDGLKDLSRFNLGGSNQPRLVHVQDLPGSAIPEDPVPSAPPDGSDS
jgi:uncharacterized membrane protein